MSLLKELKAMDCNSYVTVLDINKGRYIFEELDYEGWPTVIKNTTVDFLLKNFKSEYLDSFMFVKKESDEIYVLVPKEHISPYQ